MRARLPLYAVRNCGYVFYTIGFRPSEYRLGRLQRDNIQIQLSIVVVVVVDDYSPRPISTASAFDVGHGDPMQLCVGTPPPPPVKGAL